eukprot:m.479461 g.479461  ORF g.479461 m.479461 type:complete len:510 (+) comp21458_c0_seq1:1956-3485(+)
MVWHKVQHFFSTTVSEQWALAIEFWRFPGVRSVMLTIWIASWGGALHAPVTTFFYLKIGASETDIGFIGFCTSVGTICLAPFYGWLMDARGPFLALLISTFSCAVGCLVRGVAQNVQWLYIGAGLLGLGAGNLWTLGIAYASTTFPPARRSAVISGFLFQVTVLRILGKLMYPLWVVGLHAIGIRDDLLQDKISMSVCTVFCFVGMVVLIADRHNIKKPAPMPEMSASDAKTPTVLSGHKGAGAATESATGQRTVANTVTHDQQRSVVPVAAGLEAPAPPTQIDWVQTALLSVPLVCQGLCATTGVVLWPLWLHDRLGWSADEYAYALMVSSLASTLAIACLPSFEASLGRHKTAYTASFVALLSVFVGFGMQLEIDFFFVLLHVVLATLFLASTALLEPSLKSLASLSVPHMAQGSMFGVMATLTGIGDTVGNLAGTYLYKHSKSGARWDMGGLLPFAFAGATLALGVGLVRLAQLRATTPGQHRRPSPCPTIVAQLAPKHFDARLVQ